MKSNFELLEGDSAFEALADPRFVKEWESLALSNDTITWYQEPLFVSTWYETYRDSYTPLLLLSRSAAGSLFAFMALAERRRDGEILHAGDHQTHYQGWLSVPEIEEPFLRDAIACVFSRSRQRRWRWKFLPPGKNFDALLGNGGASNSTFVVTTSGHRNPVWSLVSEKVPKHKNLRRLLKRYKKLGDFRLSFASSAEEAGVLLRRMSVWDDLRLGAVHADLPFTDDPRKLRFFESLLRRGDSVRVSALSFDERLLAVNVIAMDGKRRCIGLSFGGDPAEARSSPTLLSLLEVGEKITEEGVVEYDMIPGGEPWKERFATGHRELIGATIYADQAEARKTRRSDELRETVKRVVVSAGQDPRALKERFGALRASTEESARAAWMRLRGEKELSFDWTPDASVGGTDTHGGPEGSALAELIRFDRSHKRSATKRFFSEAMELLRDGWTPITVLSGSELALSLWWRSAGKEKTPDDSSEVPNGGLVGEIRVTYAAPAVSEETVGPAMLRAAVEARTKGVSCLRIWTRTSFAPVVRWCTREALPGETETA
jgi:CelD/BcsL family acetyltransferase involved in cellulose biosynthesis